MPNVFLSEDYLIRMINQALAALLTILGLKSAGQYQEAEQLIHQTLESLFGLRTGLLLQLDDERIKEMMTYQGIVSLELMTVVADLFTQEAEILHLHYKEPGAQSLSLRALGFYLEALLAGQAGSEVELQAKIDRLLPAVQGVPLPEATSYLLYNYYRKTGRYQQAETTLLSLQAFPGTLYAGEAYLREELRDFYSGLLQKSGQELERGGLTRQEVQRKLDRLSS